MISRSFRTDVKLSDSYYGYKIRSYLNAYGTSYDFCRFYENDIGGAILIYNGTMVADGKFDNEELDGFIEMLSPVTVEIPSDIGFVPSGDYIPCERTLFKAVDIPCSDEALDVKHNTFIADSFPILSEAFGIDEFDAWYVDISHRIRHGVSDIYLYETTTVQKAFDIDGFVFLSHIATAKNDRGKGNAARLLNWLCGELRKERKEIYLYSKKERYTFYRLLGFQKVTTDIVYERGLDNGRNF